MVTRHITLSEDTLLAEYVRLDDFKGLLEQCVAIGPDTLAMLIKDGAIAQAEPGGHFAVGGVWRTIKDAIAGAHAIRLLIADMKPFQVSKSFSTLTKDGVPIACELTLDMQVNPEKPANILGFLKDHAAVTKASVLTRLAPHFGERLINSAVRRVDALELRGNIGLQDKVQADAMVDVERLAGDIGLLVRAVSVDWGTNDAERDAILDRERKREQAALDEDAKLLRRAVEREAETTVMQLTTDLDVEKVKVSTEDELRRLILGNELSFLDARETGVRIAQMKALEHELSLNRTQRLDGLKAQLEAEEHAIQVVRTGGQRRDVEMDLGLREGKHRIEMARIQGDLREVERSTEDADHRHRLTLEKLEQLQGLEISAKTRDEQLRGMRGLQDVELDGEGRRQDLHLKGEKAAHERVMDERRHAADAELEKMKLARDLSEAQLLAVTAGFSPAVADVLVERARASADADKMALMRELVQQAKDAQVSSEAQARHFFDSGMQGAVGVSQGVGMAAAAGGGVVVGGVPLDGGTTECPGCHRVIPTTDRFCRYCSRQMRQ